METNTMEQVETTTESPQPVKQGPTDADRLAEIEEAEGEVAVAEEEWEAAKAQAKLRKEMYDDAVMRLRSIIRKHRMPDAPLFDQRNDDEPATDPDAWRSSPLTKCLTSVKPAIIEKLEGAGITNAGQLADWQGKDHEPKVQGVGDAAIQAIDDAMVEFMATLAKSEDTPGVRPAEVLGLTGAEVEAACYANLLPLLQTGRTPELHGIVTVEDHPYMVTMPPVGHGENVYALRPLHDESQDVDTEDPYAGKIVRWKGFNWSIGSLQYLVRVSEQPAESAAA